MKQPRDRSGGRTGPPPHDSDNAYKGAGAFVKYSIADMAEHIIDTALQIKDADQARQKLVELARSAFGAKFGSAMATLEQQIQRHDKKLQNLQAKLEQAETELSHTPEKLPSSRANRDREEQDYIEEPFSEWQARHKVEIVVLGAALVLSVGASWLTAKANLVGSGLPVFTENDLLASTMAALAPLSALATKTLYESFPAGWPRDTFKTGLIGSMVVSIAAWIILYAQTYHGLSPDVSIGGLFDEPSLWDQLRDTVFVALSLSTEILIGAVLALRLTIIAGGYSPDFNKDNPKHKSLTKQVDTLTKREDSLAELLAKKIGQRAEFTHSLDLQIHTWTLAHDGRRSARSTPIL